MKLIITRFLRRINNNLPNTCYANFYLPHSLEEECDCDIFCKFPPKGNTGILLDKLILNNDTYYNENLPQMSTKKKLH